MMIPYFMQHGCTIRKAKARLKLQLSWGCPASRLSNTCKQPGNRDLGAVGVICGRFYDKEGMPVVADVDQRILGISLAQLRQIERKIFLAGGERGYDATLGALLGGYVTDLIVDEGTAEFLLACELPH